MATLIADRSNKTLSFRDLYTTAIVLTSIKERILPNLKFYSSQNFDVRVFLPNLSIILSYSLELKRFVNAKIFENNNQVLEII